MRTAARGAARPRRRLGARGAELEKVAAARPGDAELAANLAYAFQQAGDAVQSRAWEARADSLARIRRRRAERFSV
jgi:hypothetical protein